MKMDIAKALDAWQRIVGAQQVFTEEVELNKAETATFATDQRVIGVVKPQSTEQVKECVLVANKYKVPLYPVSGGKNWGYGSKVPVSDNCVVLDLNRMNNIVDFDETLAYVTVEAGVTFNQLHHYLDKKQSNLFMSVTGSSGNASLIGNLVERGIGRGPYGDRFSHVCSLEVILPTGELLRTGFDRYTNAKSNRLHRWGVGPYVDGLFTQSNFGIVTKATIWLLPLPEYFQTFFYSLKDDRQLEGLIEAVRTLRLQGVLKTSFSIINDYRFVSTRHQYPWKETEGITPLPSSLMRKLRDSGNWGGVWNGECALYSASKAHAKAERHLVERALKNKVDRLMFVDQKKAQMFKWFRRPLRRLIKTDPVELMNRLYLRSPFRGVPSEKSITTTYWRKKTPLPQNLDPERDKCGVIWCSPVVPFQGAHIRSAVSIIKQIIDGHGFEPSIGLNCFAERCVDVTAVIFYDREVQGEDERAMRCHDELFEKLTDAGYIPYRLGIHSMTLLPEANDDSKALLASLKSVLDPNRILAPGRYEFQKEKPVPKVAIVNSPTGTKGG